MGLFFIACGLVCRYGAVRTNNDEALTVGERDEKNYLSEETPTKKIRRGMIEKLRFSRKSGF